MPELLIHPGFPKAASTTLQEQLFDSHPGMRFVTPHQKVRLDSTSGSKESIMLRHIVRGLGTDRFSDCKRSNRENDTTGGSNALIQLDDCHKGALAQFCDDGRLNVFSDETLLMPFRCAIPPAEIPERIRYLTDSPDTRCRVLIIIRNQIDLMHSFYAQKAPKLNSIRGSNSISDYYFNSSGCLREGEETTTFDFNATVRSWEQAFGLDSVSVLLFEDLRFNPGRFSMRLSEILGVDSAAVEEALLPAKAKRVGAKVDGDYEVEINEPLPGYLGAAKKTIRSVMPDSFFRKFQSGVRRFRRRSISVPKFESWQKTAIQERFQQSNIDFARRHDVGEAAMVRFGYLRD